MKKFATVIVVLLVCAISVCALVACDNNNKKAPCAGVADQLTALQEVAMGKSDIAFVDYTLAKSQCGQGSFKDLQMIETIRLSEEEFAVGIRKEDTALQAGINNALVALFKNGKMNELREQFGKDSIMLCNLASKTEGTIDSTLGNGKTLTVGVTDYEPMDYIDEETEEWTGFDAEMARLVGAALGYDKVKFELIKWENKITELKTKKIDVIWNGMTVTDELGQEMLFSYSYATNWQVPVIDKKNAEVYTTLSSMKGARMVAESGSAGEEAANGYFGQFED